ncbi:MAG: DUF6796 family protein [Myxococcota bacterium]
MSRDEWIRIAGWSGIAGAGLLILGDLLIGGWRPVSGGVLVDLDLEGLMRATYRVDSAGHRLAHLVGALLGPIAAILYAVGTIQMWCALRPAGRGLAGFVCGAFVLGLMVGGGGFHVAFAFLPVGLLAEQAGATGPEVWEYLGDVLDAISATSGIPLLLGSIGFAFAVVRRDTMYPYWMVALTPMLLIVTRPLAGWIPAPVGGPIFVAHFNLCWLVFFVVSTRVLSRGDERSIPARSGRGG